MHTAGLATEQVDGAEEGTRALGDATTIVTATSHIAIATANSIVLNLTASTRSVEQGR
jgi:hypothetical protein